MNYYVMAIKPEFYFKLLYGKKSIELRKKIPNLEKEDLIYYYVSEIGYILGYSKVRDVIKDIDPIDAWHGYSAEINIDYERFKQYCGSRESVNLIKMGSTWGLTDDESIYNPKYKWSNLALKHGWTKPPQPFKKIDFKIQ